MGAMGLPGPAGPAGPPGKDGVGMAQTLQAVLDKIVPKRGAILNVVCRKPCPPMPAMGQCGADGKTYSRGTGTRITGGDVLTAHHVTEFSEECQIGSEDGILLGRAGMIVEPVAGRDLVVLKAISWNDAGSRLPEFDYVKGYTPPLGELVVFASYPAGLSRDLQISFGYVTDPKVAGSFSDKYRTYWTGAWACDAAATHGSSGGPAFNSKGELVGVIVGQPGDDALKLKFVLPVVIP